MKFLIYIIALIFLGNIAMLIYNFIQMKNESKIKSKYKQIIKGQKIQIEFLNKELEEIEKEKIFEGGVYIFFSKI